MDGHVSKHVEKKHVFKSFEKYSLLPARQRQEGAAEGRNSRPGPSSGVEAPAVADGDDTPQPSEGGNDEESKLFGDVEEEASALAPASSAGSDHVSTLVVREETQQAKKPFCSMKLFSKKLNEQNQWMDNPILTTICL